MGINFPEKISPVEHPEIEELRKRVEKLENQLKREKRLEEKEKIIKQEIKTYLGELQKVSPSPLSQITPSEIKELKKIPPPQQIGALVSLVFEKGLMPAISIANALNNPAILDEFHDILVDCYYQILLEKGILKFL